MAFWKDTMINRLSNLINRNRSAAKISQVLCSSDSAHENIAHNFLAKLDRNYSCGPKLIVRGEYLGKSNGADYKLVVRRRPEGTFVDWGLFNLKTKKQILLVTLGKVSKKTRIYLGLCPKLWVGGSKVQNFLVKITIQLFLLQTSRNVLKHVIHKWGGHIWPFHDALRPQRFSTVKRLTKKSVLFRTLS